MAFNFYVPKGSINNFEWIEYTSKFNGDFIKRCNAKFNGDFIKSCNAKFNGDFIKSCNAL